MKTNVYKIALNTLSLAAFCSILSGCAANSMGRNRTDTVVKEIVIEHQATPPPGVVEYVWEEPMVDMIDVPPGLDPEGHYYRPGHREIVEIRQGRWRHIQLENRK
ncbi:MAG: hypothetical protein KDD53_07300 [Bdellovibrionales bacterium]|nr:hypothetical protein [Bdellovibrionales bacterium]